jgi:hypothetical protein
MDTKQAETELAEVTKKRKKERKKERKKLRLVAG